MFEIVEAHPNCEDQLNDYQNHDCQSGKSGEVNKQPGTDRCVGLAPQYHAPIHLKFPTTSGSLACQQRSS
jgi:hypothetical protein